MIITIITRARYHNKEKSSLSKAGKDETNFLATELSALFGKERHVRFYSSVSTPDKLNAIFFSRGLKSKKMDYSISTIENELTKECITVMDWLSEFHGGDVYIDVARVKKLPSDLEANGVDIVYLFLSSDRTQQWVDELTGKHIDRLPESSAAVIDTSNPKAVQFYGQQIEFKKAQRDQVRKEIENSMSKAIGLVKRNL